MKKVLVSAIVVAGILGGGYWVLPQMDKVTDVSTSQKAQSADHSATTVKRTVKKSPTKAVVAGEKTTSETSTASQQAVTGTSTSSTTATKQQASTASQTGSQSSQQTTAAVSSKSATTTGAASSTTAAGQDLSASQIDNWVWQQVAPQYQNTTLTQRDFAFHQYNTAGLVYVEVYENQNTDVAHLAGRFRINNYGQLERQSLTNPDHWQVVSTVPAN